MLYITSVVQHGRWRRKAQSSQMPRPRPFSALGRPGEELPETLPSESRGTMEEQIKNSSFSITGHWDAKLARRLVADDYNGVSVFIFNGTDVGSVNQPLAMDAQKLATERHLDGGQ